MAQTLSEQQRIEKNKRAIDWQKDNPSKVLMHKKTWRDANRDKQHASEKNWYEDNKGKKAAADKSWKLNNPDKANARTARRRAARLKATPIWADHGKILAFYEEAKRLSSHVDHIVPLQNPLVCGLHCEANLQVLSGPENMSKSNRYWPGMP